MIAVRNTITCRSLTRLLYIVARGWHDYLHVVLTRLLVHGFNTITRTWVRLLVHGFTTITCTWFEHDYLYVVLTRLLVRGWDYLYVILTRLLLRGWHDYLYMIVTLLLIRGWHDCWTNLPKGGFLYFTNLQNNIAGLVITIPRRILGTPHLCRRTTSPAKVSSRFHTRWHAVGSTTLLQVVFLWESDRIFHGRNSNCDNKVYTHKR